MTPSDSPSIAPPALPECQGGHVWFYAIRRDVYGPVAFQRLVELERSGQLRTEDMVWQPHYPDWRPVSCVPGLQPGRLYTIPKRTVSPLSMAERFPILMLMCFTLFVVGHFALRDSSLSPEYLAAKDVSAIRALPDAPDEFEIEVCHDGTAERVFVAVSYYDAERADWIARGWYPTSPGDCQVLLRGVKGPVYVFAETRDGEQSWLGEGPLRKFCVHPRDAFLQVQAECETVEVDVRWQSFMQLEMPERSGRVTWRLRELNNE